MTHLTDSASWRHERAVNAGRANRQLVPPRIERFARESGCMIILPDRVLSRLKRCHQAWLPATDETMESPDMIELLEWAHDLCVPGILFAPGQRRRPQPYYLLKLERQGL